MKMPGRFLLALSCLAICFSCKPAPEQEAGNIAKEFIGSLYNLDYEKARSYCTPQSDAIISFLASNTSEEDLSMIKKAGKAQVEIINIHTSRDKGTATVLCKITNYLKLGLLDDQSRIDKETEKKINLIKEKGKWLVDLHI